MTFNTQNTQFGVAKAPQPDLQTANLAADFWRVSKLNNAFMRVSLNKETDAAEIGKGSEFATQEFPVSWDVSGTIEKILSSEFAAWAFAFGFGLSNATFSNGTYTFKPADVCDGIDMPAFSVVEQLGAACPGGAGLDRMAVGCVINDFAINFNNGPSRGNSTISVNFVGTGQHVTPSGITLPAKITEHELRGGSATVTINGTDYTGNKNLLSLGMSFANNIRLDQGFFIGSGVQDGAAIRGRMERGNRVYGLTFTTRLEQGSPELLKLKSMATGSATVTLTNSATESLTVEYHKVGFQAVEIADEAGIVVLQVTCSVMEDTTDGVVTATVKTAEAGIGGLA